AVPDSIRKKPMPRCPSAAMTSPALKDRSLNVLASSSTSLRPRSAKSGTPRTRSVGADTGGILCRCLRSRLVGAPRELVDPPLRGVQLRHAGPEELLAALPAGCSLVLTGLAPLRPPA